MRSRWLPFFAVIFLLASAAFAQEARMRTRPDGPPALPLPAPFASRNVMLGSQQWHRVAQDTNDPNQQTVTLDLSPGISLISVPLVTASQKLSDIFPNLPAGARVWKWDAHDQDFVEGFDQPLPLGHGCVLYLPQAATISVTGTANVDSTISVNLSDGWNLVGVPYSMPLPRSSQTVYEKFAFTAFEDAVADGAIDDTVFALDVNGYRTVKAGDSFQPMQAYWVLSDGAESIDLYPHLLGTTPDSGASKAGIWFAEKIGGAAVSWGASYLLNYLTTASVSPTDALSQQLSDISGQISSLSNDVANVAASVKNLEDLTRDSTQEIITTVLKAPIDAAQAKLDRYYGLTPESSDPNGAPTCPDINPCFLDFAYKAKTASGIASTTPAQLNDFATKVDQANFKADLLTVRNQIVNTNLMKSYGLWVANGISGKYSARLTFWDRYLQFAQYFNQVIGLQAKMVELISNATSRLQSTADADNFRATVWARYRREEYQAFQDAVGDAAMSRVRIPDSGEVEKRAPVVMDSDGQQVLAMTDFMVAAALEDPFKEGLRVRLIVSPDVFNAGDPMQLFLPFPPPPPKPPGPYGTTLTLPADQWRTTTGPQNYDSWGWAQNGGILVPGWGRIMRFTRQWKITTLVAPRTTVGDQGAILRWLNQIGMTPVQVIVALKRYDEGFNVTNDPSGVVFGSVTILARPAANTMLNPNFVLGSSSFQGCWGPGRDISRTSTGNTGCTNFTGGAPFNPPCNGFSFRQCGQGNFTNSLSIPFRYVASDPVTTTYTLAFDVEGKCMPGKMLLTDSGQTPIGRPSDSVAFWDGFQSKARNQFTYCTKYIPGVNQDSGCPTLKTLSGQATSGNVTLQPGSVYILSLSNPPIIVRPACNSTFTFGGFSFAPTP